MPPLYPLCFKSGIELPTVYKVELNRISEQFYKLIGLQVGIRFLNDALENDYFNGGEEHGHPFTGGGYRNHFYGAFNAIPVIFQDFVDHLSESSEIFTPEIDQHATECQLQMIAVRARNNISVCAVVAEGVMCTHVIKD